MSQIIGWEYYVSHFPVVIPESQFDAVERQAEVEYRKVVGEYMDIEPEDEKNAVFQICNFLYTNQAGLMRSWDIVLIPVQSRKNRNSSIGN